MLGLSPMVAGFAEKVLTGCHHAKWLRRMCYHVCTMERMHTVLVGMVGVLLVLFGVLLYQYTHLKQTAKTLCLNSPNCSPVTQPKGSCAPGRACTN